MNVRAVGLLISANFEFMRLYFDSKTFIETSEGMDISMPLSTNPHATSAWYCEPVKIEPVVTANFVGDVNQGGSVNFRNVFLNPHGNGTHTECVGHISKEYITINQCLREFHFKALVITVKPETFYNEDFKENDLIITRTLLERAWTEAKKTTDADIKALVIRTLDNSDEKLKHNYSNTNPPYLQSDAIQFIIESRIDHLIIDLPSVDRENDHGKLAAHHLFWNYPQDPQLHRTITELVYVPDYIKDGLYFLNIQITSLENDASPSKLVLFEIQTI